MSKLPENLIKEIEKWCKEEDEFRGYCGLTCEPDEKTTEGYAYILFQKILIWNKKQKI